MTLANTEKRQIAWITAGAVLVFLFLRFLPTGTNLNHMDFRVTGNNSIDFCDPLNPQFVPVVAVRSPVSMVLTTETAPVAGTEVQAAIRLRTASGKPIEPQDLLVAHEKLLHLLIADPSLTDYQHVHPEPTRTPGEWKFSFTPRAGGTYRVFADFTPAATARSLYANADVEVRGAPLALSDPKVIAARQPAWKAEKDGYRFALAPGKLPLRARQPIDLVFSAVRDDGGAVPMQPIMGAFAHMVAFDEGRSGFAHLHPMEVDLAKPPDAVHPVLNFKIMIPRAGKYVVWAQVNLGGKETFVPFWFEVSE